MKRLRCLLSLLSGALSPCMVMCQSPAQIDPVVVSPHQFTVLLDNEQVRVVEYTLRPGERDQWHTHPPEGSATTTRSSVGIDTVAVMAPVHEFVASFNKGDATTTDAGCSHVTSIIDDFPPHEWHGADACQSWMRSYRLYTKANGLADMLITLGNPQHVDISADCAYIVVPANYTIKVHGKLVSKTNSIVTFVLEKSANAWRIIGWAWADG